jgi:hypothetical protein
MGEMIRTKALADRSGENQIAHLSPVFQLNDVDSESLRLLTLFAI